MDDQSEHREAAAALPALRSFITVQLVFLTIVLVDRIVKYILCWLSRAIYKEGWFSWRSGVDVFVLVSLHFIIWSNES